MNPLRSTIYNSRYSLLTCSAAWLCLVVAFTGSILPVTADELKATNRVSERYLIIIDTSLSMRRNAENLQTTLGNLFQSGMNGQFKPGDSLGVWTFNESLHTGVLPLQIWSPETSRTLATNMNAFLRGLRYEKASVPETAIPQMKSVAGGSERITVMLLTAGDAPVVGTPLDRQINYAFENSRAELQKLRTPFVIVLRVQRGKFVGGSVTWSPWPVEFPEFPPLPQPKPKEQASIKPATNAAPPVKSLIVIGKKPEPPAPTPSTGEEIGAQPAVVVDPVQTSPPESTKQGGSPAALEEGATPVITKAASTPIEPAAAAKLGTVSAPVVDESPSLPDTAAGQSSVLPAQPVLATAEGVARSYNVYLIAGVSALILGVGLAVFLIRRQRAVSGGSLITRSMDREDK